MKQGNHFYNVFIQHRNLFGEQEDKKGAAKVNKESRIVIKEGVIAKF